MGLNCALVIVSFSFILFYFFLAIEAILWPLVFIIKTLKYFKHLIVHLDI